MNTNHYIALALKQSLNSSVTSTAGKDSVRSCWRTTTLEVTKDSQFIGIYESTVTDQFYSYIRPQENGTHTDLRWFDVSLTAGYGVKNHTLRVTPGNGSLSASALHYTVESLDEGPNKHNLHSEDIAPQPLTNLCIDFMQMGLGCVNSWGAWPRDEYMLPYKDYEFVFTLTPQ